jgi:hypothetical protein
MFETMLLPTLAGSLLTLAWAAFVAARQNRALVRANVHPRGLRCVRPLSAPERN